MNARLIKAAARENAASNHQEQPHFSALSSPRSDGNRLSPSAKAALRGDLADTLTRPNSKQPYNTDENAKRAAAENPSPQQPLFLRPTAESAGRMRFKRLSGKSARARDGRCETEQPVFSARLPRAASEVPLQHRRKREKSRRGKSKSAAAPFPAPHSRNRRANALQAPFREKRPRQRRQMRNSTAGFQRPFTACGERSGPQRRRKREKSRRGKSKSAAAPFPAPHSRNRRANALQAPFREKRPRQRRQMRNSTAGFQRPFTARGTARPSEAACRTPAPRAPSSRRFDIRADWA